MTDIQLQGESLVRNGQRIHEARLRRLPWWAGLSFGRTNTGGWHFSRHWPHCLCWSWTLWLEAQRRSPRRLFRIASWRTNGGRQWFADFLWVARLSWSQQANDWMQRDGSHWTVVQTSAAQESGDAD